MLNDDGCTGEGEGVLVPLSLCSRCSSLSSGNGHSILLTAL